MSVYPGATQEERWHQWQWTLIRVLYLGVYVSLSKQGATDNNAVFVGGVLESKGGLQVELFNTYF